MEVKSCRDCGKLFNYIGGARLCATCKAKLEEKFAEVKKYIQENKNATVPEVSEAMDVSTKQLTQWVREERLAFSDDSTVTINCESCGAPMKTGRFCDKCKSEMVRGFGSMYQKAQPKTTKDKRDSAKMRYLDM